MYQILDTIESSWTVETLMFKTTKQFEIKMQKRIFWLLTALALLLLLFRELYYFMSC